MKPTIPPAHFDTNAVSWQFQLPHYTYHSTFKNSSEAIKSF